MADYGTLASDVENIPDNKWGDLASDVSEDSFFGRENKILQKNITAPSKAFQMVGEAGNTASDLISENVISPALNTISKNFPETSNVIKKGINTAINAATNPNTIISKGINTMVKGNVDFFNKNLRGTEVGEDIQAIPGVAMVAPFLKPVGTVLETAGNVIKASGDTAAIKASKQAALDFIQPKQTNKVLVDAAKKQGVDFDTGKAFYTSKDEDVANRVLNTPGIDLKKNNIQENLSALVKEHNREAESLKPKLEDINVSVQNYQKGLDDIRNKILSTEGIDETERNARLTAVDKMMEITNRKSGRIAGPEILEARQKLDKTFLTHGGDLKAAAEKIYKEGIKPIRDYTNNFLAERTSNADVLASLKKQHELRVAIDNVATKVPTEAKYASSKPNILAKNYKSLLGGAAVLEGADKIPLIGEGLSHMAPYAALTFGLYKGGDAILDVLKAPSTRQKLGATLSKAGTLMRGGKPLTLKDLSSSDIAKMTPEVRKLLLTTEKQ